MNTIKINPATDLDWSFKGKKTITANDFVKADEYARLIANATYPNEKHRRARFKKYMRILAEQIIKCPARKPGKVTKCVVAKRENFGTRNYPYIVECIELGNIEKVTQKRDKLYYQCINNDYMDFYFGFRHYTECFDVMAFVKD